MLRGGRNPLGVATDSMSTSEAKEVLAILKAESVTAGEVAQKRLAANAREQAAQASLLSGQQALNNAKREESRLSMTSLEAAQDRLKVAREELNVANARAGGLSRGSGVENTEKRADNLREQANARLAVVAAERDVARETERATSALSGQAVSLPTLRYAMYDVARTAGIMSTAIAAAGTGLLTASASYETAFTAVERTSGATGASVQTLKSQMLELSRTIPQSFGDITDIAARGAQLGIATNNLRDFTNVIAQFVATSDTVTMDQAVESFGRLSNLLGDTNFDRIASSITACSSAT